MLEMMDLHISSSLCSLFIKMGIRDTILFVVKDHVTSQVRNCFKRYLHHPEVKLGIK